MSSSCRRRRHRHDRSSSPSAAPLEDDDLLSEILLRLPPLPSSLPRASAVCKRWRSLASDPAFSRRFRRHHRRNRPLIGLFHRGTHGLSFVPTLEGPDRIPPGRFSLELDNNFRFLGCRHGLVLILDRKLLQLLVWDPVTGEQHHLAIPPVFDPAKDNVNGAVRRSAVGDDQHFKVVLVVAHNKDRQNRRALACVYSSEIGIWGNLISTPNPYGTLVSLQPAVLVGDSLHWLLVGRSSINALEFDLERESLAVIEMPISEYLTVMRAEGGGMGLLSVLGFTAQFWKRNTNSDGAGSWEMGATIQLDNLLSLNSDVDEYPVIHGYAEDNNLVLLWTGVSLFSVQLESLQLKELLKSETWNPYHTFESVYAAGI